MWSCLYAYTFELYPTRARSTGAGFACGCVGAGSFVVAAALVLALGVKTRGRTLEAISG